MHEPMDPLYKKALAQGLTGTAVFVACIFLPAGTWHYWQGWLYSEYAGREFGAIKSLMPPRDLCITRLNDELDATRLHAYRGFEAVPSRWRLLDLRWLRSGQPARIKSTLAENLAAQ